MPRLGPDPVSDVATAQATLLQLLAMSPVSQQVFAREHVGPDYVRNLWRFAQMQLSADWATATAGSSAQLLHDTGIAWTPRLSGLIGAEASAPLTAALVDTAIKGTSNGSPGWHPSGHLRRAARPAGRPGQGRGHPAAVPAAASRRAARIRRRGHPPRAAGGIAPRLGAP